MEEVRDRMRHVVSDLLGGHGLPASAVCSPPADPQEIDDGVAGRGGSAAPGRVDHDDNAKLNDGV
jgi:hypothetical protein